MNHSVFIPLLTEASVNRIITLFIHQGWKVSSLSEKSRLCSGDDTGASILALLIENTIARSALRDKIWELLKEYQVPHHGIIVIDESSSSSWSSGNTKEISPPETTPSGHPYR